MPIIVRKKKKKRTATQPHSNHPRANDVDVDAVVDVVDNDNDGANSHHHFAAMNQQVQDAIKKLKRGLLRKITPAATTSMPPEVVNEILQHMQHCLIHLQQHVHVLQAGLHCYRHVLLPRVLQSFQSQPQSHQPSSLSSGGVQHHTISSTTTTTTVKDAIQHLFQWLLHLHDGYIYTISGECRHLYDQQQRQKQSKFPSRLNCIHDTNNNRHNNNKGSKLYSPDRVYSGTSWDEFMDPTNGLRNLLWQTLRPSETDEGRWWDDLTEEMDAPGYALELIVTRIEQQMQEIQTEFNTLTTSTLAATGGIGAAAAAKRDLCHVISTMLVAGASPPFANSNTTKTRPTVTLHWKDKMESLRITCSSWGTMVWERYGNTFHLSLPDTSILPRHWITAALWWKGGMSWSATTTTATTGVVVANSKRRRIITTNDDDDDDDDDDIQRKNKSKAQSDSKVTEAIALQQSSAKAVDRNTNTTSGLVVKMIADCNTNKNMNSKESVNDIKLQLGINVHDRESAYDIVQAEEAGATFDAEQIDHDEYLGSTSLQSNDEYRNSMDDPVVEQIVTLTVDDEIQDIQWRLKQARRTFIRMLKEIARFDAADHVNDELNSADVNIWNGREVLRESYMSAGDVLLWSVERRKEERGNNDDNTNPQEDSTKTLQKAIQYFKAASDLVVQQQKLHKIMNPDASNDNISYTFFCRNLLLLQTKAQINIGIGHIQLGIHGYRSDRDPNRRMQFQMAVQECQIAYDMIKGMDHTSYWPILEVEKSTDSDDNDQIVRRDQLEALQLGAFSIRWKATALWYLHRKSESFSTVDQAIVYPLEHHPAIQNIWIEARRVSNSTSLKNDMTGLLDMLIDVYLEHYFAWTTIADLASQSLERATVASIRESRQSKSFYDTLLDYVVKSLSKAAKLSRSLKSDLEESNLMERYKELCDENRILPTDDLVQSLREIEEWWRRRLTTIDTLATKKQTCNKIERGELFSSAQHQMWEDLPTRRYTIQPNTRRSKYNLGGDNRGGTGYSSNRHSTFGDPNESNNNRNGKASSVKNQQSNERDDPKQAAPKRSFRKWREDMTYDSTTGSFVSDLVYPSIAPPMPRHIQEILKSKSK